MQQNQGRPARRGRRPRPIQHSGSAPHRLGTNGAQGRVVTVLPYVLVLAGVAAGLLMVFQSSANTVRGTALAGCALLVAALARLVLPPRYAGALTSRNKAFDVAAFVVLGGAVLGLALSLPR